jgi:4-amino-4-deoxy-L-arabinose transferase-like glycosyltransferase
MIATAFALRVGAMCLFHTYRFPAAQDHYLFGTEMGRIARSLVSGAGFGSPLHGRTGPTAMVGPVYPFLIAATFKVWGVYTTTSAVILLALNALFSAATAAVVYFIGKMAFEGSTVIWAGWSWVFFPFAIYWPVVWVWDTSLSSLLFALVFAGTLRLTRSMTVIEAVWYGVIWGLAVLTNTTFLPLLPLLLGWICHRRSRLVTPWIRPAAAVVVAFGLTLAPWLVRNYFAFGHVLLRSNLGLELALGNSPGAGDPSQWQRLHPSVNPDEMAQYRSLGELRYMAAKQRQAVAFITRHRDIFVRATATRVLYFWFDVESLDRILHFPEVLFGIPALFAFAGLSLASLRREPTVFPFAAVVVVFPLVYYVTHPDARFRHLIEPEVLVLAAYGGLAAWQRLRARFLRPTPRPPAGVGSADSSCTL